MNLEELSLLNAIITVLWIMGPAYIANSVAVLTGGKYPIDQGRTLSDGNRILGDGKTWSGLLGGTLGGIAFGILLDAGNGRMALERLTGEEYVQSLWSDNPILIFFLLSFGALFGDMAASFYKRRQNLQRGDKFAILDMYDFIFMSLLLCYYISARLASLMDFRWMGASFYNTNSHTISTQRSEYYWL